MPSKCHNFIPKQRERNKQRRQSKKSISIFYVGSAEAALIQGGVIKVIMLRFNYCIIYLSKVFIDVLLLRQGFWELFMEFFNAVLDIQIC